MKIRPLEPVRQPPRATPARFKNHQVAASSQDAMEEPSEMTIVAKTSQLIAAMRGFETARPATERRIHDPYAFALAGKGGKHLAESHMRVLAGCLEKIDVEPTHEVLLQYVAERTSHIDEQVLTYLRQHPECRQVVNLGAGMDTRPWRLELPKDLRVFEIDCPEVIAHKHAQLKDEELRCFEHHYVAGDLRNDKWASCLQAKGFDVDAPTLWIAEGLFYYIPLPEFSTFLAKLNGVAQAPCGLIYDCNKALHPDNPIFRPVLDYWNDLGVQPTMAVKECEHAVTSAGWQTDISQPIFNDSSVVLLARRTAS